MRHEARKLKKAIAFVTSPGYLAGTQSREEAGLVGGPSRVITDKAIFGFHPESKRMMLISIHPGNTIEDVINTMGFKPEIPSSVPFTEAPSSEQLRLIRKQIDPTRMYMG
jgi:glutaconate CoA-transferase subunit B